MEAIDLAFEPAPEMRRFTAREFQEMFDREVFGDEPGRLELLDGVVYSVMAEGSPHRRTANLLTRLLTTRFPVRYIVQVNGSLHLGVHDVPSPDFVVFRENGDSYASFVDMTMVVLAIEVADTSLRKDRILKTRRYGLSSIPEYWIVDVNGPAVDLYSDPRAGEYASFRRFGADEPIAPSRLPGEPVTPREIVVL
jgi:Uma2 family endonuclease